MARWAERLAAWGMRPCWSALRLQAMQGKSPKLWSSSTTCADQRAGSAQGLARGVGWGERTCPNRMVETEAEMFASISLLFAEATFQ